MDQIKARKVAFWMAVFVLVSAAPVRAQQAVPDLTGRVVDLADILSPSTEGALTELLAAHEEATSNQVAVLTIPSLEGETIESYAIRVAETWGLGTAQNDNGVLLLVALNDRAMRIEVGLGLEGDLTDALASQIIRNEMAPHFRRGAYDTGVVVGVQSIVGAIEGTYTPTTTFLEPDSSGAPPFIGGVITLFIVLPFLVISVLAWKTLRWLLFFFLLPFVAMSGWMLFQHWIGVFVLPGLYLMLLLFGDKHPKLLALRKKMRGTFSFDFPSGSSRRGASSSGSSSSSSSWSSSSSSSSSSFSSSSFSGGGGSFGGGGSSGSW